MLLLAVSVPSATGCHRLSAAEGVDTGIGAVKV
jgi:hypothetical protein